MNGLKFKMPLFRINTYISNLFSLLVMVLMAFIPDMRVALSVEPIWFLILYVGYKLKNG